MSIEMLTAAADAAWALADWGQRLIAAAEQIETTLDGLAQAAGCTVEEIYQRAGAAPQRALELDRIAQTFLAAAVAGISKP